MYDPVIRGNLREGSNADDLLPISKSVISKSGNCLSEQTASATSFVAVKVNVNVVILAIDWLLYEWFFQ